MSAVSPDCDTHKIKSLLSDIDFEILPGEIHGLLGENGAGKSTLMKIINGALTPTTGDIYIDGEKMSFDSPHAAANHGIRMVYQELDLFPHLTVAENICQGNIPKNKAAGNVYYCINIYRQISFCFKP